MIYFKKKRSKLQIVCQKILLLLVMFSFIFYIYFTLLYVH